MISYDKDPKEIGYTFENLISVFAIFLLFKTVSVASEYIPPSAKGAGVLFDPVATELAVEPGNLSAPVACRSANCV